MDINKALMAGGVSLLAFSLVVVQFGMSPEGNSGDWGRPLVAKQEPPKTFDQVPDALWKDEAGLFSSNSEKDSAPEQTVKIPGALSDKQNDVMNELTALRYQLDADIEKAKAAKALTDQAEYAKLASLKADADGAISELESTTGVQFAAIQADFQTVWNSNKGNSEAVTQEVQLIDEQLLQIEKNVRDLAE